MAEGAQRACGGHTGVHVYEKQLRPKEAVSGRSHCGSERCEHGVGTQSRLCSSHQHAMESVAPKHVAAEVEAEQTLTPIGLHQAERGSLSPEEVVLLLLLDEEEGPTYQMQLSPSWAQSAECTMDEHSVRHERRP